MPGYVYTPARFAAMGASPYGALSTLELRRRTGQFATPALLDSVVPAASPVPAAASRARASRRGFAVSLVALSGLAVSLVAIRRIRRRRHA